MSLPHATQTCIMLPPFHHSAWCCKDRVQKHRLFLVQSLDIQGSKCC